MLDAELHSIFGLFIDEPPVDWETINTSHGESDFREVIIARFADDSKLVIKAADNDFTFAEKIKIWQRCAEEYRKLGYCCPAIYTSKNGDFPTVRYKERDCIAYAEEYSLYKPVSERDSEENCMLNESRYMDDAVIMTAKIAAAQLHFCEYPSGYCLFERFCPSDKTDEVLEVALKWKNTPICSPHSSANRCSASGTDGWKIAASWKRYIRSCRLLFFRLISMLQIFLRMKTAISRVCSISISAEEMCF